MDPIPAEDLEEMDLDEQMNEDESDDNDDDGQDGTEDDDREDGDGDEQNKEIFIPGKHKLAEGEQLVRDERYDSFVMTHNNSFSVHIFCITSSRLVPPVFHSTFCPTI